MVVDRDGDSPKARRIWDSPPPTLKVLTSRGRHRYYRIPKGMKLRSRKQADGLDLEGNGGYVVAPPSTRPSGTRYEFVEETKMFGIAALPDELLEPEPQRQVSPRRLGRVVATTVSFPLVMTPCRPGSRTA